MMTHRAVYAQQAASRQGTVSSMSGRSMRQDARLADSGDVTMGRCAREDVRAVLARLGISSARRAVPLDSTEEVIVRGGVHGWM